MCFQTFKACHGHVRHNMPNTLSKITYVTDMTRLIQPLKKTFLKHTWKTDDSLGKHRNRSGNQVRQVSCDIPLPPLASVESSLCFDLKIVDMQKVQVVSHHMEAPENLATYPVARHFPFRFNDGNVLAVHEPRARTTTLASYSELSAQRTPFVCPRSSLTNS